VTVDDGRSLRRGGRGRPGTGPTRYLPPRPTPIEVLAEVGAVIADLPRFAAAPLLRSWHLRWGATAAEVAAPMSGDDLLVDAAYSCTRAIGISAPPAAVWPWLVQVGCLRAGFYSDDLLDNLAHPSADRIVPELQDLRIGRWVPMSPTPSDTTAFRVHDFLWGRRLLWVKPDSTWSWALVPIGDGTTRLVTRLRAQYDWSRPGAALAAVALMEFGDFAMMRRMLRGIRERAEGTAVAPARDRPRRGGAVAAPDLRPSPEFARTES